MRHFFLLGAMLLIVSCGMPSTAIATLPPAPLPTSAPPTRVLSPTTLLVPTAAPTSAATQAPTDQPTQAPTNTPTSMPTAQPSPIPVSQAATLQLRTIQTDDGFVTVRAEPTTQSAEVTRLPAGTVVECVGFVSGEQVFGTNQWANCPSVGGYILAALLTDQRTAVSSPPAGSSSDADMIVAAVRANVGDPGFAYDVEDVCIDGEYATATVSPQEPVAEGALAVLYRVSGGWQVTYVGEGFVIGFPGGREQATLPAEGKCPEF